MSRPEHGDTAREGAPTPPASAATFRALLEQQRGRRQAQYKALGLELMQNRPYTWLDLAHRARSSQEEVQRQLLNLEAALASLDDAGQP